MDGLCKDGRADEAVGLLEEMKKKGLRTVHKTHNHFIQKKNKIKMGLTLLFTHLKIILLQYFQFSAK